jgi:diacylglycerol kinase family enzyme
VTASAPPAKGGVFHLLNPSGAAASFARAALDGATSPAPWARVSHEHPAHTETLVDWALQEGVRRLVVWGGDGTFHRVVGALWKRRALDRLELALVPAGTCNDLARRLDLSKYYWRRWESPSPEGTLASLTLARLRWDGPGGVSGEDVFVNNAGFGRPRDSYLRKDGPWGVLRSFRAVRTTVRWPAGRPQAIGRASPEAGRLDGLYYMMLVCSGPYFSGGLHFESAPSPEDGRLRAYLVPASSKTRLALRLLRGRAGFPLMDSKVTRLESERFEVETDAPVWPQADGEAPPESGTSRMVFETLPERVRLWRPASGEARPLDTGRSAGGPS